MIDFDQPILVKVDVIKILGWVARTLRKPLMRLSIGVKIKSPLLEVGTSQVVLYPSSSGQVSIVCKGTRQKKCGNCLENNPVQTPTPKKKPKGWNCPHFN